MSGKLMVGSTTECCEARPLGVMEQLVLNKNRLQEQIADVDAAIAMLEKHHGVEECLTQLSRVGIYR